MKLFTDNLNFVIDEDCSKAQFIVNNNPSSVSEKSDFWRLIIDDGFHTELAIKSHKQKGKVVSKENGLYVKYEQLISEIGSVHQICLTISITVEDGLFKFIPHIENCTDNVRVIECLCPIAEFTQLCGEKENDMLYMPYGNGQRKDNPWAYLSSTEVVKDYYYHNEYETYIHYYYPCKASMGWFGVESNNHFLYIAKYDPDNRGCLLVAKQTIHSDPTNLMLTIDHFPATRPGESMTLAPTVVGLLDGDWRSGAKRYRSWAESTFYKPYEKHEWVQKMTGWQRIIMRNQWGEDFLKPEELPDAYRIGAKYGLHTLFLFGWWKGGFDRMYPDCYLEPMDGLKENIKKVQELGGRVILVCNGHSVDPQSDFYRNQGGDEVQILDINGNIPYQAYTFPGQGQLHYEFATRNFVNTCAGSKRWRELLFGVVKQLFDLGADCAFVDCYGGPSAMPCFNDKHEHGPRIDEEWISRKKFFQEAMEYAQNKDLVLATEWVTDVSSSYAQFNHGCHNANFLDSFDVFAPMYRYTFPETISTIREMRCAEGRFDRQLKGALTAGLRIDAEVYVCRGTIDKEPKYAEMIGYYASKLNEYGDFLLEGRYTVLDGRRLPVYIKRGEFISKDGTQILRILFNGSDNEVNVYGTTLASDEIRFEVFDMEEYVKMPGVVQY